MASAELLVEKSFLLQIKRVRAEITERVSRAHQVLHERETALLSELKQLEDSCRGEGVDRQILELYHLRQHTIETLPKIENNEFLEQSVALLDAHIRELEANLETAGDSMRRVELEWDDKLEEILSMTGSIRVSGVSDYKEKGNPEMAGGKHTKTRPQATRQITEHKPIRGLKNIDTTCFMNSVLQCLSHTLPLRHFYVSDEYKQYLKSNRGDLSNAFKLVMVVLWSTTSNDSVDSNDLKAQVKVITPKFPSYNQHDAHEFMRFLLNELHEEINRASVEGRKSPADNETLEEACARYLTWEDSRISELFGGMLRSDVCCSDCSNQSTVYIPFMDIALPIPEKKIIKYISSYPTVQLADCLNMLTTKETLNEEERPYCNKCKELTKSTKKLDLAKLPRFLVIQLKRFSGDHVRTKLSTPVKFDETWRLVDCVYKMSHTYSLYGIVCHSGSISHGHYVAYCKYRDDWRCFDDSMASIVSWKHVRDQEAYILFYKEED